MQAALAYAQRGLPVFPLQPKGKLPLIPREKGGRGFEDATTDTAKVREWWSRWPEANIGIPTGRKAGFWALDVDKHGADGDETLAALERIHGALPPTVAQMTPTGGHHRLFKVNGAEIRNRASKAGPGIDARGDGGYIVVPPSIHPNGRQYQWMDGAGPDSEFAEAPAWLVDLLTKKPEPQVRNDPAARPNAYADSALVRELAELSRAHEGQRNEQLNISAFKLGQLVGAGHLSRGRVELSLRSTALGLGLDQREVEATLKSGLDAGALEPREIPERKSPPARLPAHDPETGEVIEPEAPAIVLEWFRTISPSMEAFDFVEGLLTSAGLSVLYGEPGCGKTFLILDLALHVALGRQWMDRAVDRGAVIYVALEGQRGLSNRIAAFRRHHGLDDEDVPFAVVRSSVNMLNRLADVPALIAAIKAAAAAIGMPVFLVVIDTLSRALCGGDENSSEDMGALIANAGLVIAETSAHVCFVHHSGKDKARGSRGHSNLKGAVDTEIEIVRDEDSRISTAKVRKQKDLDLSSPFSFELKSIDLGINRRGKPVTSCVVVAADNPENVDDPVERMNEAERMALEEVEQLVARAGRMVSPEPDMHPVMAVSRDQIRDWFLRRGLLGRDAKGNLDGTSRSKLSRAMSGLKQHKRIAIHDEWVWLT